MRALTVQQPWAWAIVYGGKDVENRTQAWGYRGPLAWHGGGPVTDVVHVITDLGPTEGPGLVVPAQLGRITPLVQEFINGMPIYRYDPWRTA